MSATLINGKTLAANIAHTLRETIKKTPGHPTLCAIQVGEDPASQVYLRAKAKASEKVGIQFCRVSLKADVDLSEILFQIQELNKDPKVHGIIVQLPLPDPAMVPAVIQAIAPEKDVDGLHPLNQGRLFSGDYSGMIPCTPLGCLELIQSVEPHLSGKHAVVVGRSVLVGRPMTQLLLAQDCTVTHCHGKTVDLAAHTRQADILVSAVGKQGLITADMVKPGATVIDVGITRGETQVIGDVHPDVVQVAKALTPVPGGVGPMTVIGLMENTVRAWQVQTRA